MRDSDDASAGPLSEDRVGRNIGVGCFTFVIGGVSGAMTGVFVGKGVGFFSRCEPLPGLPACDWWWFALAGAVLGAVSLPLLAFSRLRRSDRRSDRSTTQTSTRG